MTNIIRRRHRSSVRAHVVGLKGESPRRNYENFLERGRYLDVFDGVDFEDLVWKIPTLTNHPGGQEYGRIHFTARLPKDDPNQTPMAKVFADFIKSLVKLDHHHRARKITNVRRLINVSRLLHEASADVGHDPCRFTTDTFRSAEQLSRTGTHHVKWHHHYVGTILEKLAKTLTAAGITPLPIEYVSKPDRLRAPPTDDDPRLPEQGALSALARASQLVTTPSDILRMRIVELLLCGSWRINEILTLPADCEVFEPATRNGKPLLDAAGNQIQRYGLRFAGSKGFAGGIKWSTTAMSDVARRAISQIRELTAEARAVAEWMDRNPGRAWLTDGYRLSSPDRLLSRAELFAALRVKADTKLEQFVRLNKIPRSPCSTFRAARFRVGDVEQALLRLHKPILGEHVLPRSKYLLIIPRNFISTFKLPLPPVVDVVTYAQIADFLRSRGETKSIFERLDLRDESGKPYRLSTHQFRHFIDTVAAEGGLGEVERALWAGRATVQHNDVYDHEPPEQLARKARSLLAAGKMHGTIAETYCRLPPVDRAEFSLIHLATVHTTDIGLCFHDWGTAPCPHHGACATCRDCGIVKGDPMHRARIELLLHDEEMVLAKALFELGDGTYGASNWVEHHRRTAAGYRAMLAIHDDPGIEDGSIVQVKPEPARKGLLDESRTS